MLSDRFSWLPVIRIKPLVNPEAREWILLGRAIGVAKNEGDRDNHCPTEFQRFSEHGGLRGELQYGLFKVKEEHRSGSTIYLRSDEGCDLIEPIEINREGDLGAALMDLSNFINDAWCLRRELKPFAHVGADRTPIWRLHFYAMREEINFLYITFPKFQNGKEMAAFERKLFDLRDAAHYKLRHSLQGRLNTAYNAEVNCCHARGDFN